MNEAGREREEALAKVADYENRISWHTSCGSCARILDSAHRDHERAERAEAALREALDCITFGLGQPNPGDLDRWRAALTPPAPEPAATGATDE
jgi:hypothetical protein